MPNNNPAGHNQYTKRKEQFAQTGTPDVSTSHNGHDGSNAHGSTNGHESSNGHEGTRESHHALSEPASVGSVSGPAKRGFAAMDEATQRGIASKGGQSQGKENNPGNFANDRDRAREAGRKGGEAHGTHRDNHLSTHPSTNH